jgi:anti-anti-sigma factor
VDITNRAHGDVLVVKPTGRIDHSTAADFERAVVPLLDASGGACRALVFDFAGVPYISSVGLRVLVIASKAMRGRGGRVAVASMQPVVSEIVGICRLGSLVDLHPTVEAALVALAPPSPDPRAPGS